MPERQKVTPPLLSANAATGTPITWLACSDGTTSVLHDEAGA